MPHSSLTRAPTFGELFTPKLVTILREGYGFKDLRADALAGLTVAIVALPLSMAIAIASGTTPERGLYTSIAGGFFVSLLGGSRFQIGGPAGAFIVLVAACIERNGIDGLVLATLLSGLFLLCAGFLRLGTYIKFIPFPVTVGFTAGIAATIFASQIRDLLGLMLTRPEPAAFLPKLQVLASALPTFNPAAIGLAVATIAIITLLRRFKPGWPGFLIAVTGCALATAFFHLPVETIGSRFGGIPQSLPHIALPDLALAKVRAILPDALAFTLLGAIESLLSASVADGMTGRRHRSNCELVAQGVANIASSLVGGICVTGTIARTATNVRAGSHGPVSGMLHSIFLLAFLLLAAPLARFIPLAGLAGVLAVVAWNMVEKEAFAAVLRSSKGDALVLSATLLITVFRDLIEGILVGFGIGTLLFLHRMSQLTGIESHAPMAVEDKPDSIDGRARYDAAEAKDKTYAVYRISGAFFFGAAQAVGTMLDRLAERPRDFILDFAEVPLLDSTAANTILGFARKARAAGVKLTITAASPSVRHVLWASGVHPPEVRFEPSIASAMDNTPES